MDGSNYNQGSGRGGSGGGGGRGGSGGRGGRAGGRGSGGGGRGGGDQYYHQQRYHQQPAPQWGPSSVQGQRGPYRAPAPAPMTGQVEEPIRRESGQSSARGGYGGGGRGAWGGSWRGAQLQRAPEPRPDMSSLKISDPLPASSLVRTNEGNLLPIRRPDRGGTHGIQLPKLLVNHFPVKFNATSTIIHYNVDIKLVGSLKSRSTKIPKSNLRMIKDKLFSDDSFEFPQSCTAYDGEKNIFSAVPLPIGKFKVDFSMGEDTKGSSYDVTITEVNKLELSKLKDYMIGKVVQIPRDVLQGMDLAIKENPSMHRIAVGRSFYQAGYNKEDGLDGGIIASKGFQQSLKLTSQGPALCVDYSILPFHKPLPVLDFLKEHISEFREVNDVNRLRRVVLDALRELKVMVTHRVTKQKYTIRGLSNQNTWNLSFDLEDPEGKAPPKRTSLVEYFKEKYGKDIKYKDIPCIDMGKNNRQNYVPMEFCLLVEGQRFPKESLSKHASAKLKSMSLARPRDRMNTICQMVSADDGPCGGGIAQNFGIEVIKNMTRVEGRVIEPPRLKLGGPNGNMNIEDAERRQWNLVRKLVVDGKPVERWALIDFSADERKDRLNAGYFVQNLRNRCQMLGIRMEGPLVMHTNNMKPFSNVTMLRRVLEDVVAEANKRCQSPLQIIVCAMAWTDPGYKSLKWLSETQIGIVTQCCLSARANEGNDQYFANLSLKINAKLGGSNFELSKSLPRFEGEAHIMFVGADVNHPAPRNITCPSIAAVVATVNWPAVNRYAARVHPQPHRMERILNFGSMCLELIQAYARINKVRPQRIVIFRDGVSEGQFDMVLNQELVEIRNAIFEEDYRPTITLVVAQKRHQTRLFPETPKDGGSKGNVPPGTVVDTMINHPFEFDFYLCSHYGGLGTSKPTHYYVLWDEHKFSSDQLQKLIYDLCFTFARCTKPVSLVPPVYYADIVAYRGRMFQEAASLVSASSSSSSVASDPSDFEKQLYKLHPDLENNMFFV
ncbi:hypothetical protein U1Q18_027345 [Sarracenia purpurea var. burkii]